MFREISGMIRGFAAVLLVLSFAGFFSAATNADDPSPKACLTLQQDCSSGCVPNAVGGCSDPGDCLTTPGVCDACVCVPNQGTCKCS